MGDIPTLPTSSCRKLGLDQLTISLANLAPRAFEASANTQCHPSPAPPSDAEEAYNLRNLPSVCSPPVAVDSKVRSINGFGLPSPEPLRSDSVLSAPFDFVQAATASTTNAPSNLPTPPNELQASIVISSSTPPPNSQSSHHPLGTGQSIEVERLGLFESTGFGIVGASQIPDAAMESLSIGGSPDEGRHEETTANTAATGLLSASDQPAVLTPPADAGHGSHANTQSPSPHTSTHSEEARKLPRSPPPSADPLLSTGTDSNLTETKAMTVVRWLESTAKAIVDITSNQQRFDGSVKVLSQALPLPSNPGHQFPELVQAVKRSSGSCPITFINVLHAVPGRSTLSDLPTSAPTTPGPPIGGDDYFAVRVFDSAVQAIDYDNEDVVADSTRCALAAPSSLNVSIVERYIPPCTAAEVLEIFEPGSGRSLLVDRLTELSPQNGCLVFIYPTFAGARTFTEAYLGPALDPLLRSMVVRYTMSSDFSQSIGTMYAVDDLHDFLAMQSGISSLCQKLSDGNQKSMHRADQGRSKFSLVHSQTASTRLEPSIWAAWWVAQEKVRIKRAIMQYYRTSNKLPVADFNQPVIHQSVIYQELISDFEKRALSYVPQEEIELGVFVIKREG